MPMRALWFVLLALLTAGWPRPLPAKQQVEDSERLRLVRRATGDTEPAGTSFQARLDAVLNPSAETVRTSVANQEQQLQQALVQQETALEEPLFTTGFSQKKFDEMMADEEGDVILRPEGPKDLRLADSSPLRERGAQNDMGSGSSSPISARVEDPLVDATETSFILMREDILNRERERRQDALEALTAPPALPEEEEPLGRLAPSLENNPFYVNPMAKAATYEDQKPVLISRLVQQGYPVEEAAGYVQSVAGTDELMILLIKDQGYTYGEARDLVRAT